MEQQGFEEVYQLDGGILRYFEEVGGDHYDGECFVFDQRVAVDPALQETETTQCYACQAVLTSADQTSEFYDPPHSCPKCYLPPDEKLQIQLQQRNLQLRSLTQVLPGAEPYHNVRPVNVPLKYDQQSCLKMFLEMHGHVEDGYWEKEFELDRIVYKGKPMAADDTVRSGYRIEHLIPHTTEPSVSNEVEFLYEDEAILVLNKPAPLPMHAGGRFNRNTLNHFLDLMYDECQIRIVHRLDANTTGVVVYAKKRSIANQLLSQFRGGTVEKEYVALVHGVPQQSEFSCAASIGKEPDRAGTRRVDSGGAEALTDFKILESATESTLLKCLPRTGRTNQIRIHLAHLGLPIVGDPAYGIAEDRNETQTLSVDCPPMCLHAEKLTLNHPLTEDRVSFNAALPSWATIDV